MILYRTVRYGISDFLPLTLPESMRRARLLAAAAALLRGAAALALDGRRRRQRALGGAVTILFERRGELLEDGAPAEAAVEGRLVEDEGVCGATGRGERERAGGVRSARRV